MSSIVKEAVPRFPRVPLEESDAINHSESNIEYILRDEDEFEDGTWDDRLV